MYSFIAGLGVGPRKEFVSNIDSLGNAFGKLLMRIGQELAV